MLKNTKYNLVSPGQRSKGETEIKIRKEMPHKRLIIITSGSAGGLPGHEMKKNNVLNISPSNKLGEEGRYERFESAPNTFFTDAHNSIRGNEKKTQEKEC